MTRSHYLNRVAAAGALIGVAVVVTACNGTAPGNPPHGHYTTLAAPAQVAGMPGKMIEFCEAPAGKLYYALDSNVYSGHASAVAALGAGTCPTDAVRNAWGTPEIETVKPATHMDGAPGEVTLGCDLRNGTLLLGGSSSIYGSYADPALAAIANGCEITDVNGKRSARIRAGEAATVEGAEARFQQTSQPSQVSGAPGDVTTTCLSPSDALIYSGDSGVSSGHTLSLSTLTGGCGDGTNGPRTYQRLPGGDIHILGTPAIVREFRDKSNGALVISGQSNYDGGKYEAIAAVAASDAPSNRVPRFTYLTQGTSVDQVPGSSETVCDTTHNVELLINWSGDTVAKRAGQSLSIAATKGCPSGNVVLPGA